VTEEVRALPDAQPDFAELVEQGVRAYMHAEGLHYVTQGVQYIAVAALMGISTLDSWRSKTYQRLPRDYESLQRFAAVCLKAAPELGEAWLTDLFRAAGMAGYRDQAVAEIFGQLPSDDARLVTPTVASTFMPTVGLPPELPAYHITRAAQLKQLKALVLEGQETGAWIALLGMTGIGKSTLLTALAHEADVQIAFPDGIVWFEVKQGTQAVTLARAIAQALQQPLPTELEELTDVRAALRTVLSNTAALLLLDNITDPQVLAALPNLEPGVVVVLTTRSEAVATALRIPEQGRLILGKMTPDEAWELAQKFSATPPAEVSIVRDILVLLEYHPYAILVTLGAAKVLHMSWESIYEALRDVARSHVLTAYDSEHRGMWASLEMDWEQLTSAQRYALISLGQLPFFTVYSVRTGQAAWNATEVEATVLWRTLAALQLVHPIPGLMGYYSLHWLVRDFAQQKAHGWSLWERLRFLLWPWRYRLPFRLRWWWPALPKAVTRVRWPWWSPRLPGTKGTSGLRPIRTWLTTTAWRRGPEDLRLHTTPQEWVVVTRLSVRMLVAALLMLCLAVAVFVSISLGGLPFVVTLALAITVWIFWVAYADLRRAVLLWAVASSSPFQAASPNVIEEGPA